MSGIRLIADDLTGALDAGVQFTGRVPGLPVLLGAAARPGAASAAISTGSRDLDADAAAARMARAAPFLAGADIGVLKIDSLLRGPWPGALATLLDAWPDHTCIFAPSFPAQRRITRGGRQYAPAADGALAPVPVVPAAALHAAGLRTRRVPAGPHLAAGLRPAAGTVLICDAATQDDLDRLVAAGMARDGRILWCGTAGLARALAGAAPRRVVPPPVPPLVLIGSNHPVTRGQLAALAPDAAIRLRLGHDAARSAAAIAQTLAVAPCIVTADLPDGLAPAEAAIIIADRLAATLLRLPPPPNLVVIGGETLAAVCRAVGAEALRLDGEIAPGVPASRIGGGIWDGVFLISRSGAFGGPSFLADLLAGNSENSLFSSTIFKNDQVS